MPKQVSCKLCGATFVCDNGMWSTTCDCGGHPMPTRPVPLNTRGMCEGPMAMKLPAATLRAMGLLPSASKRGMNKLESRYHDILKARELAGEVAWFGYEVATFKLADDCRYTPDFLVLLADGRLECHECKGFMRGDAQVKIKVAARMIPLTFRLARYVKKQWVISEVKG